MDVDVVLEGVIKVFRVENELRILFSIDLFVKVRVLF